MKERKDYISSKFLSHSLDKITEERQDFLDSGNTISFSIKTTFDHAFFYGGNMNGKSKTEGHSAPPFF